MFLTGIDQRAWCSVRQWNSSDARVSKDMAAILTVTTSLTRFLERRYGMRVSVRLHDQFVDKMTATEAALLKADVGDPAMRRQVSLVHRDSVMFDAESVLPLDSLPTSLIADLEEGKRPLANLLSDQGLSLSRSDLSVMKIDDEGVHANRWARRSVLRSESGARALVVEVFHDEMWRRLQLMKHRH